MKSPIVLILAVALIALISCLGESSSEMKSHGDERSELAILMREMFDQGLVLKGQVDRGEELTGLRRFEEIHSAIPTDPEVSGPLFDAFATSYLNSVSKLEESDSTKVEVYNAMVDQCMSCHTEFCPGPKRVIKKLYLD